MDLNYFRKRKHFLFSIACRFFAASCYTVYCPPFHLVFLVFTEPIIILLCVFYSPFLLKWPTLESITAKRTVRKAAKKNYIAHIYTKKKKKKEAKLTNNKSKLTNNYLLRCFPFVPAAYWNEKEREKNIHINIFSK